MNYHRYCWYLISKFLFGVFLSPILLIDSYQENLDSKELNSTVPIVIDMPLYDTTEPAKEVSDLPLSLMSSLTTIINDMADSAVLSVRTLVVETEPELVLKGYGIQKNSPEALSAAFTHSTTDSKLLSTAALVYLVISENITMKYKLNPLQIINLNQIDLTLTKLIQGINSLIESVVCILGCSNGTGILPAIVTGVENVGHTVLGILGLGNTSNKGLLGGLGHGFGKGFQNEHGHKHDQGKGFLHGLGLGHKNGREKRQIQQFCNPRFQYREFNGFCNNLNNPLWGNALSPFGRLLNPVYDDGVGRPRSRSSINKRLSLALARKISSSVHTFISNENPRITHMLMQWGQFLDHDITQTPTTVANSSDGRFISLDCCRFIDSGEKPHPGCIFPILIPKDDPFFRQFGVKCMQFVRSSPANQKLGVRQQLNQLTPFIDASQIYGSTIDIARSLRSFTGGRLTSATSLGQKDILPPNPNAGCPGTSGPLQCFRAGDVRVNVQAALSSMHTLWLRQHNRLANLLGNLNTQWDDEKIYQEARRIIWAQLQYITYNEFLPLVLGIDIMEQFGLTIWPKGFHYTGYSATIEPVAFNSFATAAYRFGHSSIQEFFHLYNFTHEPVGRVPLKDSYFRPFHLYTQGMADKYLLGLSSQKLKNVDPFMEDAVTKFLFRSPFVEFGLDLASMNIQRGRDHGLPPYNRWREFCGLKKATNFEDLAFEIPSEMIRILKQAYKITTGQSTVDDIDLFTGGLAELAVKDGTVGPTFACIIARQFYVLKRGDRFWFENNVAPNSLTLPQVDSIKDISLAKIICDNSDDVKTIQRKVMEVPSDSNPQIPCDQLLDIDINLWKEN